MGKDTMETRQKITDFLIGFFLNIGIAVVYFILYTIIFWMIMVLKIKYAPIITVIIPLSLVILMILLEFFLIRHFFRTRRYTAIGMLSSLLLPLLITGFCSVMFSGSVGIL